MNKKKLQMIEFPSISNTIKKYDNFQNEIIIPAPKKIQIRRIYKVKGFNKSVVAMAIFYIVLLVSVMMMKMWMKIVLTLSYDFFISNFVEFFYKKYNKLRKKQLTE